MDNWRDELTEVIKSQAEREAEDEARQAKRLRDALVVADEAMGLSLEAVRFAAEQIAAKGQAAEVEEAEGRHRFTLHGSSLALGLDRERAVLEVALNAGRAREFDFANDRHLAPREVEEYVGRRVVELVRSVKKTNPW